MFKPPFAAAATAVLVMLAGGPFGVGEAHARAIYKGTFDPRGPVYGFDGEHEFAIDEACLSTDGWKAVNTDLSVYDFYTSQTTEYTKCGEARLTGGKLNLRKFAAPSPDETVVDSATFMFPYSPEEPSFDAWGIYVEDGELKGVDTFLVGDFGPFDAKYWWLQWASGFAPFSFDNEDLDITFGVDPVFLFSASCADVGEVCFDRQRADVPPAIPTFTRVVPEPGSLALAGLALAALAGLRRRSAT